jgi:hypothetical protein
MGKLAGLNPDKPVEPCKVGRLLLELDSDDAQVLLEAMSNPKWTSRALAKALSERGVTITGDTLKSHTVKACRCSRT